MLKTCLDCLAGSRVDNDVYGTVLNGQTNTMLPDQHLQDEIMFRLPRPLNVNDEVEVSGKLNPNPDKLFLSLMTGTPVPDKQNIPCQVEVCFKSENKIFLRSIENNVIFEKELDQSASDVFPDSDFKFLIKVRMNANILDIDIGESYIGSMELKQNLQDITFLTLSNNIDRVEELNFKFG